MASRRYPPPELARPAYRSADIVDFCKQRFPPETISAYKYAKDGIDPWSRQAVLLALERRLFDALWKGHWKLEEIGAKRWKGGWLIYVKCRRSGGPLRRWNSFGPTPNEALMRAASKLSNWGFETKGWQ